jgi:hypothetical protein
MFDDVSDAGLIDGIGAASRAESAAMARRLALIGELDARRAVELVERRWWRVDPFLEVAAEVAAALNISRSRVGDQIHLARVLRDECRRWRRCSRPGRLITGWWTPSSVAPTTSNSIASRPWTPRSRAIV